MSSTSTEALDSLAPAGERDPLTLIDDSRLAVQSLHSHAIGLEASRQTRRKPLNRKEVILIGLEVLRDVYQAKSPYRGDWDIQAAANGERTVYAPSDEELDEAGKNGLLVVDDGQLRIIQK